jgi:hypothetical protein
MSIQIVCNRCGATDFLNEERNSRIVRVGKLPNGWVDVIESNKKFGSLKSYEYSNLMPYDACPNCADEAWPKHWPVRA